MLHYFPSPNGCRFIILVIIIIMGAVFQEMFVSLITLEVYMFKDVQFLRYSGVKQTFFQTIYCNLPKGEGSTTVYFLFVFLLCSCYFLLN